MLQEEAGLSTLESDALQLAPVRRARLLDINVFLQVKALMNGTFIISVEERLEAVILAEMSMQHIEPALLLEYAADATAELMNLIIDKTVSEFAPGHS